MPRSKAIRVWDGRSRLPAAILVDVDGTLVGPYRGERRELRESALPALRLLASRAPVFLWSIAGPDNGKRLLGEFPELRPYVRGTYGKDELPLEKIDRAYAIDDDPTDEPVSGCQFIVEVDCYFGGQDSGSFLEAARSVAADLARVMGDHASSTDSVPLASARGERRGRRQVRRRAPDGSGE